MGKQGRPRKSGKRTKSGRLIAAPNNDTGRPSQWVSDQLARYGQHYSSALGRAYVAGLLGKGADADLRYDNGKKFARIYARVIGKPRYRCALDTSPRAANIVLLNEADLERDAEDQAWIMAAMDAADATGARPYMDQLLSELHTDRDPYWLASLLAGGKHPADVMVLNAALVALDALAGVRVEHRRVRNVA